MSWIYGPASNRCNEAAPHTHFLLLQQQLLPQQLSIAVAVENLLSPRKRTLMWAVAVQVRGSTRENKPQLLRHSINPRLRSSRGRPKLAVCTCPLEPPPPPHQTRWPRLPSANSPNKIPNASGANSEQCLRTRVMSMMMITKRRGYEKSFS